ncbi:ras guanine nucleotide exchange factor domain-containing protein [Mycena olivaceomarginata]|nr:ras guanine nucleotide exchange factor domain-containing protein [Mycena olivaceomarginata]
MVVDDGVLEKDDMFILDRMKEFLVTEEAVDFPAAKQLLTLIEQKGSGTGIEVVTPPLVLQSSKELKPLDIDPVELARQLTIMESQLYCRIRPLEWLQQAHGKATENGPRITYFIQNINKIQFWVAGCILSEENLPQRAKAVEHAINMADCCRSLNNFSTMYAITSGLNFGPRTADSSGRGSAVDHKHVALFKACEDIIGSHRGFSMYRSLMTSVNPPCVPLRIYLSSLRFIQDGYPDMSPAKDRDAPTLINFRKRCKAWEVPYNLDSIPSIQACIGESLNSISDTTESGFWERSLALEPRAREDEKMARLLQESGFL